MAATVALTALGGLTEASLPKVREFQRQQRYPGSESDSEHCIEGTIGKSPASRNGINPSTSLEKRDSVIFSWNTRLLLSVVAVILVFSVESAFAQIDPTRLIDRSSSGSYLVSKNQLLTPGKAVQAAERAHKDIMGGHLESAQKEITRALDIAPHFGAAEALQGGVFLQAANYEEAAKFFQKAMDDDPALGAAYVGLGMVLIQQKRFQLALSQLDHAEALLPGAWLVHFAKAWDYLDLGNTEAALKQVDSAERIAGKDPEKRSGAFYLRALASLNMKDIDRAREYFAETVAGNPNGEYAALAKKTLERIQPLLAAGR